MSQLGNEKHGIITGLASIVIGLLLIFLVHSELSVDAPSLKDICSSNVNACREIWGPQTALFPIVLLVIVAGVVIGILYVFSRDEKNEYKR